MTERYKALITGGRGFIGHHLDPFLRSRGHDVAHLDVTDGLEYDILDRDLIFECVRGKDVVFHLAGLLGTEQNDQIHKYMRVNVEGSVNVFDAAREHGARVILASKINPWVNAYTASKIAAEAFARVYSNIHGVDIRTAQLLNLYGPHQKVGASNPQKAVPTFILRALQDEPVPVFGDGEQTVDLIHISDAVKALFLLGSLQGLNGEAVEIGTGEETTVNFLAETIIALADSKSRIEHVPMREGEPPRQSRVVANTSKMTTLLQFEPSVSLTDGLRETIQWYRRKYLGERSHYSMP